MEKQRSNKRPPRAPQTLPARTPLAKTPPPGRGKSSRRVLLVATAIAAATGAALLFFQFSSRRSSPPVYRCEVLATYPHAPDAFTQGLVFDEGVFYESTGGYGQSSLRRVAVETGEVIQRIELDERHFGEGIALVGDEIYQVTWRSRIGFVYDKQTFEKLREFKYVGEGWGLTYDGRHLVMSDGSDVLRFLDPQTLREARRLRITSGGRRLSQLNELEYADGFIYANLWHMDYIVKISPESGRVVAWFDLRGLLPPELRPDREAVLNGIAHDPETGRFFVTGKNWPRLFAVRFPGGE